MGNGRLRRVVVSKQVLIVKSTVEPTVSLPDCIPRQTCLPELYRKYRPKDAEFESQIVKFSRVINDQFPKHLPT